MRRLPFLLLPVLLGLVSCAHAPRVADGGPLILLSIDGFRWDYLDRYEAPTLRRLAAEGVHARRLNPCFPSKTFPNHYTLVTGLRPGRHGIVANWFHDPDSGDDFSMARTETRWWAGGEPVWITAEKQGVRAACYFWPGSETELQGHRPSLFRPFDKRKSASERVDGLLEWLARPPAERPRLCVLYFDHVDTAGHDHGPEAAETGAAVRSADEAVARLLAGLARRGLRDSTNLVIVSDHGMAATSPERVVFLDDLMDLSLVSVEASGPYGGVRPKPGVDAAALLAGIRAKAPPQVRVYRREEMPERLHYDTGDRIPPILLLTDPGWCLEQKTGWPAKRARYSKGNHGWDPATADMGALFIAHGPAFRRRVTLPTAENVDVYNLLCATLGLRPAPNDGGDALARAALRR
ncbi:MAG: ectonucleotide pyrophosphatase/phosphodiesterase [Verrucomicrobiota bacterium]